MRNVLSVSLPEQMAKELNSFAKATGRNKSDILKESLSNYLWEIKFKETRKRLSSKAKKAGFITDDDYFQGSFMKEVFDTVEKIQIPAKNDIYER